MEMLILHVASLTTENVTKHTALNMILLLNYYFILYVNSPVLLFSDPPASLNVGESVAQRKRRTLVAPDMNLSLDQSEGSVLSDDFLETPDDLDINVEDIETPDDTDSLEFINNGNELEWEGQTGVELYWNVNVTRKQTDKQFSCITF